MSERTSQPINHTTGTDTSSAQLRLMLLRVAGGNPAMAQQLRAAVWQDYCDAGQPFGPSEEAMLTWLAHERHGHQQ